MQTYKHYKHSVGKIIEAHSQTVSTANLLFAIRFTCRNSADKIPFLGCARLIKHRKIHQNSKEVLIQEDLNMTQC